MTTANPEAVRSYYDYIDAEEYDSVFSLFAEDVTYKRGESTISGLDQFREFYLENRPLEDGTHEIHAVVSEDDTVSVRGEFAGVQDGEEVAFGFADFHRFDSEGKITERWTYTDRDEV